MGVGLWGYKGVGVSVCGFASWCRYPCVNMYVKVSRAHMVTACVVGMPMVVGTGCQHVPGKYIFSELKEKF